MHKDFTKTALAVALVACTGLLPVPVSLAAEVALEEIVVTARKREENLQDLAMSVSALGQQEIQANFATDLRDLIYMSPNTVLEKSTDCSNVVPVRETGPRINKAPLCTRFVAMVP